MVPAAVGSAPMITHFIEASQSADGFNHGKFMLGRLSKVEAAARSALPGYESESLWTISGRRRLNPRSTLVLDLQTGEGAAFALRGLAVADLAASKIWVCPMFEPFLCWLYEQGLGDGSGDIKALPRFVALPGAEGALYGYRREGTEREGAELTERAEESR